MNLFWAGLLAVVFGAAMQGSFALPQKFVRGWAWEKTWLFYSLTGMVIIPWLLVSLVIPDAAAVYAGVDPGVLGRTALFGAGWGVGSVLFGLGIARVGIALAFAIIISITAAVGSVVPLAVLHPDRIVSRQGALLFLGLAVAIVGVVFSSRAGALKDEAARKDEPARAGGGFYRGLAICIASGITSPMMNFSFAFGTPIADEAVRLGAGASNASFAIFAIAVSSGFLINAGYCVYLLNRNGTWGKGAAGAGARNALYATAMGALWLLGFFLYGSGATWLGEYGPVLGWPIFMTVMVLVANFWGIVTGEWKNAGLRALRCLAAGIVIMIAALAVMAAAARA